MIFALSRTNFDILSLDNFDILSLVCLPAVFLSACGERNQRHTRGGRFRISPPSGHPSFKRPKGARPVWLSPWRDDTLTRSQSVRATAQIFAAVCRFSRFTGSELYFVLYGVAMPGRAITLPGLDVSPLACLFEIKFLVLVAELGPAIIIGTWTHNVSD